MLKRLGFAEDRLLSYHYPVRVKLSVIARIGCALLIGGHDILCCGAEVILVIQYSVLIASRFCCEQHAERCLPSRFRKRLGM